MADAKFFDYLTGVATKLVPLGDTTYAPATVAFPPLSAVEYDYIAMSYAGGNLIEVRYYNGGPAGTLMNTLTLGYDGSNNLISVQQS